MSIGRARDQDAFDGRMAEQRRKPGGDFDAEVGSHARGSARIHVEDRDQPCARMARNISRMHPANAPTTENRNAAQAASYSALTQSGTRPESCGRRVMILTASKHAQWMGRLG